jgi:ABC-type multidrug transport system fused ATPase/permease subunit
MKQKLRKESSMKKTKNNLKFLWNYSNNSKHLLILVILLNIIKIIINTLVPLYSAKLVLNLSNNELHRLLLIALILLILNSLNSILNYITLKLNVKFSSVIYLNIEKDIIDKIHTFTNKTLDNTSTGTIIDRLDYDLSNISNIYFDILYRLTEFIKSIGIIVAIFIINPLVGILSILSLTIIFLIDNYQVYKVTNLIDDKNKKNEKFTESITEVIRGMRDIKMLNIEKNTINKLDNQVDETIDSEFKINKTTNILGKLASLIDDLTSLFNISFYVFLISKGSLTISNALVLYNYYSNISSFGGYIGQIMDNINKFNISSERIKELFDNEKFATETFGTKHIKKVKGKFEFKSVHFGYKKNEVLKGVSFTVNPDETVAFVGKTGSGKTTIFNLLCKMYDIDKGEILIDNININELDKNTIRGNITVISQSPYIFNMSIKENLKLVKPNLTNKEMKEALKTACLYDFVESLPDKYDTILGEGGVTLSGGQKQRLAIARAFIQKTEIILFDEATSALDNETQEKITKAINNMKKEYTIMIIAHRLSTIINADKIFFLNNGKIECSGTHEYLLKHSKEYKKLYETEIKTKK